MKWIILAACILVAGFFVVNNFVLDEPIVENQYEEQDTTQKGPSD